MRIFAKADGSKAKGDFALWGDAGTYSALGFMLGMTLHLRRPAGVRRRFAPSCNGLCRRSQRLYVGFSLALASRHRQASLWIRLLSKHDLVVRSCGYGESRPCRPMQTRRLGSEDTPSGEFRRFSHAGSVGGNATTQPSSSSYDIERTSPFGHHLTYFEGNRKSLVALSTAKIALGGGCYQNRTRCGILIETDVINEPTSIVKHRRTR